MPTRTFTSQRHEDQVLELCLRSSDDELELFSDKTVALCNSLVEKRFAGHASWFTKDDIEALVALYRRTESYVVRCEIQYTLEFVARNSHDSELVRIAQASLAEIEAPAPIVKLSKRRILEWR